MIIFQLFHFRKGKHNYLEIFSENFPNSDIHIQEHTLHTERQAGRQAQACPLLHVVHTKQCQMRDTVLLEIRLGPGSSSVDYR